MSSLILHPLSFPIFFNDYEFAFLKSDVLVPQYFIYLFTYFLTPAVQT